MSYILIFVATIYDNFERIELLAKPNLTFWPLLALTLDQGHSKSKLLDPDYVQPFHKIS